MRHCAIVMEDRAVVGFFYIFSTGEINRIHHWCSVGTEKSQPEGPPFQWETRLAHTTHTKIPQEKLLTRTTVADKLVLVNQF